MAETPKPKHVCSPEHAVKFKDWLKNRGGLALWQSINLSNPGQTWTSPVKDKEGNPVERPSWQSDHKPYRIITDIAEVEVVVPREVKRFQVGVEMGDGLQLNCTDGATRRIRSAVDKAGPEAWYTFDYFTQEAIVLVPDKKIPLAEFEAARPAKAEG